MRLGSFEIFVISDGLFRVDPRAFPEGIHSYGKDDVQGRILIGLNCLLIKSPVACILVDAGMGVGFEELVEGIERTDSRKQVRAELKRLRVSPEDVTHVILSHLHFDHVGGCTVIDQEGHRQPAFPNAIYWIQAGELEVAAGDSLRRDAESQNPAYRFAYHPVQWEALEKAGVLKEISGDAEIIPGVKAMVTGGHTRWHQMVLVESEGHVACYPADLLPTASQLTNPDPLEYDLYPEEVFRWRRWIVECATGENWLLIFDHAPRLKAGYVKKQGERLVVERVAD